MGPLYHLKIGHYAPVKNSWMGQETTLARESSRHDGCVDDQGTGIGDAVDVLVDHTRSGLLESEEIPSLRAYLQQGGAIGALDAQTPATSDVIPAGRLVRSALDRRRNSFFELICCTCELNPPNKV